MQNEKTIFKKSNGSCNGNSYGSRFRDNCICRTMETGCDRILVG